MLFTLSTALTSQVTIAAGYTRPERCGQRKQEGLHDLQQQDFDTMRSDHVFAG
jgi:hypothetical protein